MKEKKTEMIPVPLPTEIPPPPRLDQIPLDILHSATVEMLIQQNEDLSSRLKVNIRRNSQLEQRILSQEKEIGELNRKRENVLAQIELIKEKEKIWSSQKQDQQRQVESSQKEMDLLELRYNELYTSSKQRDKSRQIDIEEKQKQLVQLEQKLDVMHRVRIRAKERLRQLLLELAHGLHKSHKSAQQTESSNRLLKRNFTDLKNEIIEKEAFFREQLLNLKNASESSLRALDEQITELRDKNNVLAEQKQEIQTECEKLQNLLHDEKKNRIRLKRVSEELSELKNERIRTKREFADQLDQSEKNQQQQVEELKKLRTELQKAQSQLESQQVQVSDSEKQILSLSKDNKEMADQLASLQQLWMQAQERLEKEELRSETLEKINRQLSQQAKEERVEKSISAARYRTIAKPSDLDL